MLPALSALALSAFAVECLMNFTNLPTNQPFLSYLRMIIDFYPGLKVKIWLVGWKVGSFFSCSSHPRIHTSAEPSARRAFSVWDVFCGRSVCSRCVYARCVCGRCVCARSGCGRCICALRWMSYEFKPTNPIQPTIFLYLRMRI